MTGLHAEPLGTVTIDAAYLNNVNTVTLSNAAVGAELLRAQWAIDPCMAVTAFGYRIDSDAAAQADVDTYGARLAGQMTLPARLRLRYVAELAAQRAALGSDRYDTQYGLAALTLERDALSLKLGHEQLGSDAGSFALQTPLGTRHAFQGWADVFLKTPDVGLRDAYVAVDANLQWFGVGATYHQFRADEGHVALGHEIDAQVSVPLPHALRAQVKLAHYQADNFGVDTDKFWLQIEYHL